MAGLAGVGLAAVARPSSAQEALEPNTWEEITTYNNYYEFGTGKDDPAKYAGSLITEPWSVKIDGLVDRPGDYDFKDILSEMTVEETHLSLSLCRGMVDGGALERVRAGRSARTMAGRTGRREICRL